MYLKTSSANGRPSCLGLNVLIEGAPRNKPPPNITKHEPFAQWFGCTAQSIIVSFFSIQGQCVPQGPNSIGSQWWANFTCNQRNYSGCNQFLRNILHHILHWQTRINREITWLSGSHKPVIDLISACHKNKAKLQMKNEIMPTSPTDSCRLRTIEREMWKKISRGITFDLALLQGRGLVYMAQVFGMIVRFDGGSKQRGTFFNMMVNGILKYSTNLVSF